MGQHIYGGGDRKSSRHAVGPSIARCSPFLCAEFGMGRQAARHGNILGPVLDSELQHVVHESVGALGCGRLPGLWAGRRDRLCGGDGLVRRVSEPACSAARRLGCVSNGHLRLGVLDDHLARLADDCTGISHARRFWLSVSPPHCCPQDSASGAGLAEEWALAPRWCLDVPAAADHG